MLGCQQTPQHDDVGRTRAPQSAVAPSDLPAKPSPRAVDPPPIPAVSVPPAEGPADGEPRVLWETSVDLDGDGRADEIRLVSSDVRTEGSERADDEAAIPVRGCLHDKPACSATLHVGNAETELELTPGYFGGIDLSTIDIDAHDGRRELLYRRRTPGNVDPPFLFSVGFFDGEQLRWQELDAGFGYDAGTLEVPGKGVITTTYDGCSEVTTTTYRRTQAGLEKVDSTTKTVRDPSQCAACPYVYVKEEDHFVRRGEILRNLSSPALNGHQTLPLDLSETPRVGGFVHIQLREEKAETTYLDSIWLQADGVDYLPAACDRHAYCTTNDVFHRVAEGERLDLYFAVPPTVARARLEAVGHYVPRGG